MSDDSAVVENPYFDEVAGGVTVGGCRDSWSDRAIEVLRRREELVEEYAWAIPNHEAIATIADHAPVLEVGAGRGYWAALVRGHLDDADAVVATEPNTRWNEAWATVLLDLEAVDAVETFGEGRTLLLGWPPYDDPMAADALEAYPGDTVIYVGEGRGGCTAGERFHRRLHEQWELSETVAIPTFLGIRDRLEVWERAAGPGGDPA